MDRLLKNSRLEILACPICKGELELAGIEGFQAEPYENEFGDIFPICRSCNVGFPICNDIPVLLQERAFELPCDRNITVKKSL